VRNYSSLSVSYNELMTVRHMEIRGLLDYYKKAYTYGRSRTMYKHILTIPSLSPSQRLAIFKNVIVKRKYSFPKSLILISLLIIGVVVWQAGALSILFQKPSLSAHS